MDYYPPSPDPDAARYQQYYAAESEYPMSVSLLVLESDVDSSEHYI